MTHPMVIGETQKDIELMCQGLQKAIEGLKQERDTIWGQCEKEIVKLVLVMAKKVIYSEVSKGGSEVVEKVVAEAVDLACQHQQSRFRRLGQLLFPILYVFIHHEVGIVSSEFARRTISRDHNKVRTAQS